VLPFEEPAGLERGDGRGDLVGDAVLPHADGEPGSRAEKAGAPHWTGADRSRAVELGMAVRVGHECEDFRGRHPHKHLAGDPARARVDLNHSVSHASDCTLRLPQTGGPAGLQPAPGKLAETLFATRDPCIRSRS
jgi:hypothetical protein